MTKNTFKNLVGLLLMVLCLGIALFSKNYIYYKLFASMAIIMAALASHFLSQKKNLKHD